MRIAPAAAPGMPAIRLPSDIEERLARVRGRPGTCHAHEAILEHLDHPETLAACAVESSSLRALLRRRKGSRRNRSHQVRRDANEPPAQLRNLPGTSPQEPNPLS